MGIEMAYVVGMIFPVLVNVMRSSLYSRTRIQKKSWNLREIWSEERREVIEIYSLQDHMNCKFSFHGTLY